MSIFELGDGSKIYTYDLELLPCSRCGSNSITLFENETHDRGGGWCTKCLYEVNKEIPKVPSMHMLLDIWNAGVKDVKK